MKPVSILDQDFAAKIGALSNNEARASVMEHAIRAQIKERLSENPAFYERLSQQLERIIAQMRQQVIDAAATVKELWKVQKQALSVADLAAQQGLSEVSFAVYELLEQRSSRAETPAGSSGNGTGRAGLVQQERASYNMGLDGHLKSVALSIEKIMAAGQSIVDWQHKEDVQRIMRRDTKRELRRLEGLSEEELNELAARMVEIARRKLAR